MIKKMGCEWNLRLRMAKRGMFATSDLVPLLAERGIALSREQVYRLVTGTPQRLSLDVFAALCDILECTPNDLIEARSVRVHVPERAAGDTPGTVVDLPAPHKVTVRRPENPLSQTRDRRCGNWAGGCAPKCSAWIRKGLSSWSARQSGPHRGRCCGTYARTP